MIVVAVIILATSLTGALSAVLLDPQKVAWGQDLQVTIDGRPGSLPSVDILNKLQHQHVVLIGDSLTRYQYLNLVHWVVYHHELEHQEAAVQSTPDIPSSPPIAYKYPPNTQLHRNLSVEANLPPWNEFYRQTNKAFHGFELCDCYRAHGQPASTIF